MNQIIVMVGPAGSGKSTYADILARTMNARGLFTVVVGSDDIRAALYGDASDQRDPARVFNLMWEHSCEGLNNGLNVIYDATNLNSKRRAALVKKIKELYGKSVECVCMYMVASCDACIERQKYRARKVPEKVIRSQFSHLNPPEYDEGWDQIRYI